jgi:hypothetical protein
MEEELEQEEIENEEGEIEVQEDGGRRKFRKRRAWGEVEEGGSRNQLADWRRG